MGVPLYAGANVSTGNGVTTVFPYNFKILDAAHLELKIAGVLVTTGYTVDGVGNSIGGNVTITAPPAVGATVQRARKVPYARTTTDYQYNGDLKNDAVNTDFDLEEMQLQQIAADVLRAIKGPLSDAVPMGDLPSAVARASMYLAFDSAGNPIVVPAAAGGVPAATLVAVTDTIAALKALAIPVSPLRYHVGGYAALGDGGGGMYYWNSADTTADNGGTVIQPNAGGVGRWNKI